MRPPAAPQYDLVRKHSRKLPSHTVAAQTSPKVSLSQICPSTPGQTQAAQGYVVRFDAHSSASRRLPSASQFVVKSRPLRTALSKYGPTMTRVVVVMLRKRKRTWKPRLANQVDICLRPAHQRRRGNR
eukprot:4780752-Amphidinium_carterae.1